MKIDLHVHTSERSGCGRSTEEEQIRTAINVGLDAIAFTDHGRLVPAWRLAALNKKYKPFKIFSGIEITASHEDFVIIGLDDFCLETSMWSYPDLHAFVRKNNGYIIWAHPFRHHAEMMQDVTVYKPDAVEVRSVNTPAAAEQRIRDVALALGLRLMWNSDSHIRDALGSYYNVLNESASDDKELVQVLRRCKITRGGVGTDPDGIGIE